MENNNESILKKIRGLLAIANDHKNDEESQSAFILAQKLMIKNKISVSEVEETPDTKAEIDKGQVTVYKKLFWWERELASIIAKNFRVKNYLNLKKFNNTTQRKKAIMFFGLKQDVELAKQMYILAYDALKFYSERYVDIYYGDSEIRVHRITNNVKDSYMRGFLEGLETKFNEQVKEMQQEYGLMVLVPKVVEDEYKEFEKGFSGKGSNYRIPSIEEMAAYSEGYCDGNKIDYTKSTIDEEVFQ